MEQWISENLSKILDFQVPEDLIQYIQSIQNESDLNEYMKTLLDFDNVSHKNFFLELAKRKFPKNNPPGKQSKKKISKNKQQVDYVSPEAPPPMKTEEVESKSKKKTKFVSLYSQEGKNAQVVQLKGRHHCDCQASKHELINNCLQCGRIVCRQEGSGPCLFCGNLVCTPEEQREINTKTKSGAKLAQSLMEKSRPKGWEEAIKHRNRLLEYDRTSEKRTHVTDDDSDYFMASSVWLSESEKERLRQYQQKLHDKKHASRRDKKLVLDFAGRQVVDDNTIDYEPDQEHLRKLMDHGDSNSGHSSHGGGHQLLGGLLDGDRDVAPGVNAPLLQFDESVKPQTNVIQNQMWQNSRVQDLALQEMSDAGKCLSMHQPWASLLVEGIKLHEGRTWYSNHRGRLWIAATVKPPDQAVVRALEDRYRVLYPEKQFKFPSFYPTGCLLGCVNVDDCLTQEEYDKKYPGGESDSPYVFVCSNSVSLKLRFPVRGQHKIYNLDKSIHQAAIKCIQKMGKMEAEQVSAG